MFSLEFCGPGRRSLRAKSQKVFQKVSKKCPGGSRPPGFQKSEKKKSRKRSEKSPKVLKMVFGRLFGPFSRLFSDFGTPPRETFSRLFGFWPRDSFSHVHRNLKFSPQNAVQTVAASRWGEEWMLVLMPQQSKLTSETKAAKSGREATPTPSLLHPLALPKVVGPSDGN